MEKTIVYRGKRLVKGSYNKKGIYKYPMKLKIDGNFFLFKSVHLMEHNAISEKKEWKNKGYYVRIIEGYHPKMTGVPPLCYLVYTRKK